MKQTSAQQASCIGSRSRDSSGLQILSDLHAFLSAADSPRPTSSKTRRGQIKLKATSFVPILQNARNTTGWFRIIFSYSQHQRRFTAPQLPRSQSLDRKDEGCVRLSSTRIVDYLRRVFVYATPRPAGTSQNDYKRNIFCILVPSELLGSTVLPQLSEHLWAERFYRLF